MWKHSSKCFRCRDVLGRAQDSVPVRGFILCLIASSIWIRGSTWLRQSSGDFVNVSAVEMFLGVLETLAARANLRTALCWTLCIVTTRSPRGGVVDITVDAPQSAVLLGSRILHLPEQQ